MMAEENAESPAPAEVPSNGAAPLSPDSLLGKRKRDAQILEADEPLIEQNEPKEEASKKKKKRKRSKATENGLDLENSLNPSIGAMDAQLAVDMLSRQTKRFATELSELELEDLQVPSKYSEEAGLSSNFLARPCCK